MRTRFVIAFLLLFFGTRCFALEAKFFKEHACIADGPNASQCEVEPGDTLSQFAKDVYGNGSRKNSDLIAHASGVIDPNRIQVGRWVIIPDRRVSSVAVVKVEKTETIAIAEVPAKIDVASVVMPTTSPEIEEAWSFGPTGTATHQDDSTFSQINFFANVPVVTPTPAPIPMVVSNVAVSLIPIAKATPAVLVTSTPSPRSSRKVAGYEMPISLRALVLRNTPLQTRIIFFKNKDDEAEGIFYSELPLPYSRVRFSNKEKKAVLDVPLSEMPTQLFALRIGGINQSIPGEYVQANGRPLSGKFPGPHPKRAWIVQTLIAGGMASAMNPIMGGVVIGARITTTLIQHRLDSRPEAQAVREAQQEVDAAQIELDVAQANARRTERQLAALSNKEQPQ